MHACKFYMKNVDHPVQKHGCFVGCICSSCHSTHSSKVVNSWNAKWARNVLLIVWLDQLSCIKENKINHQGTSTHSITCNLRFFFDLHSITQNKLYIALCIKYFVVRSGVLRRNPCYPDVDSSFVKLMDELFSSYNSTVLENNLDIEFILDEVCTRNCSTVYLVSSFLITPGTTFIERNFWTESSLPER